MQRRDFLLGTLTGAGAAAGVAWASRVDDASPVRTEAEPTKALSNEVQPSEPPPPPEDLGPMPPDGRRLSYAQQGEDLLLADVLGQLGIERPRFLDIGAFHPTISSNTYLLYLRGARGVLVEPNPYMVELLRKARPEDTTLAVGVGLSEETEADYHLIRSRPQLNTFSLEQVERYREEAGQDVLEKTIRVPLLGIEAIIEKYFDEAPDLVSIDVEGLDLEILRRLDFEKTRPAVLCVETIVYGTHALRDDLLDFLAERDYVARAGSFVNTVFVDRSRLKDPGAGRLDLSGCRAS